MFLRLCSAGLFPGEAVMLLGFGIGEAREGRVLDDSWFRSLRVRRRAWPTELGLAHF